MGGREVRDDCFVQFVLNVVEFEDDLRQEDGGHFSEQHNGRIPQF